MPPKEKKSKKSKPEEEPIPELVNTDGDALKAMINEFRDKLTEIKSKRNYVQNERDLLEGFAKNTMKDSDELRFQVQNKNTEAEQLETDHRVEVKVYMQKVKHLEYDARLNAKQAQKEGDRDLKVEDDHHEERLRELQKEKNGAKKEQVRNEEGYQSEVKNTENQQAKMMKLLKEDYEKKLQVMIDKYEDTLVKLRRELELKLKVEIHEIEERKNQHLNELMRNHEAAFAELKAYYNEITIENLTLIKAQKQRIEELQASLIVNGKLITEIKAKNKAMEEPLQRNQKLRDDMKYALRLHQKDIMALANLKTKLKSLKEKITKLEREQDIIDARYAKVIKEKKELETRFEKVTTEVKHHADAKNVALSRKLGGLSEMLEIKDTQLQQIVRQSNIDPMVVGAVNAKLQESIESKNALIRNLQYSIQHASKAYNDAIRVYEAKLTEFGVPADELGFQVLETKASLMPAGLVSSQ